jgi:site-specific recombinase XerD
MKKKILFKHKGITLKIAQRTQTKDGVVYTDYILTDYTSGKRVRHVRASLKEARAKAEDICERMVTGRAHVLDIKLRDEIHRALEALRPTGIAIDAACFRFAEMVKITGSADVLLSAARLWRERGPDKPLTPKPVKAATDEFLAQQKGRVSAQRHRTTSNYLDAFTKAFAGRNLHEIEAVEIDDLTRAREWSKKTRNEVLNCLSLMFKWAIAHHYARENPASNEVLKRERLPASDICIFSPQEARKIMLAIKDELKPFMALWLWSGLRKTEIARLSWEQVNQGLASGSIFIQSSATKTRQCRAVPIGENVRQWLARYGKASGLVLPFQWQTQDELDQTYRLNDVTQYVRRKAQVDWKANAPRHSFCTYRIKLTGDPAGVADEMGTSMAKIEKHYRNRSTGVTLETAKEWFSIVPGAAGDIVPLLATASPSPNAETASKVAAA